MPVTSSTVQGTVNQGADYPVLPGSGTFLPPDVTSANILVWFDADDATTITKDGGNNISEWRDKSGNLNHVDQTTAADQPLHDAAQLNGRSVVRFDGVSDHLDRAVGLFSSAQPNTIFGVVKFDALAPSNDWAWDGGQSANRHGYFGTNANETMIAGASLSTGASADTNPNVIQGDYNGASSELFKNGTSIVSGDAGAQTMDGITLGDSSFGAGFEMNGYIAEWLMYDNLLSAQDIANVEQYLGSKWGITIS